MGRLSGFKYREVLLLDTRCPIVEIERAKRFTHQLKVTQSTRRPTSSRLGVAKGVCHCSLYDCYVSI